PCRRMYILSPGDSSGKMISSFLKLASVHSSDRAASSCSSKSEKVLWSARKSAIPMHPPYQSSRLNHPKIPDRPDEGNPSGFDRGLHDFLDCGDPGPDLLDGALAQGGHP